MTVAGSLPVDTSVNGCDDTGMDECELGVATVTDGCSGAIDSAGLVLAGVESVDTAVGTARPAVDTHAVDVDHDLDKDSLTAAPSAPRATQYECSDEEWRLHDCAHGGVNVVGLFNTICVCVSRPYCYHLHCLHLNRCSTASAATCTATRRWSLSQHHVRLLLINRRCYRPRGR